MKVARETVAGGYGLVVTDELKRWVDARQPLLIVDTMPRRDSCDQQHLPGAVPFEFPVEELKELSSGRQAAFGSLLGEDRGRLIVVYCGLPTCGRSHNGAVRARRLGDTNVVRYVGGIKACGEAGYPVGRTGP